MKITREKHLSYMNKLIPFIATGYVVQSYFLMKYELGYDIVAFLGVSLACVIAFFFIHDHYQEIYLRPYSLELKFSPLNIENEYFYSDIAKVEIVNKRFSFADVKIELNDGQKIKLYHVDNAETIQHYLLQRR